VVMTRRKASTPPAAARLRVPGVAFLLSQLGYHSSRRWKARLAPLGLDPRHVMVLRRLAGDEGRSQQALGDALQIPPSRMVALVDALEQRGLLRRRPSPSDRRVRTLHLTKEGRRLLSRVMEISLEHEQELCSGLQPANREQLLTLLNRLAAEQGLAEGIHPGAADPDPDER
jgi:DNA-binding MarR family transcriptional regulator